MNESAILHETTNFWVYETKKGFEILMKGSACSYVVGYKKTLEAAKSFIEKAEKYPEKMKKFLGL